MKPTARETDMLLFKQLPEWRQDNPYILRGYRPLTNSYWWCCRSLTYLHNQTLNIYTHLIGLVLFALLGHAFRYTLYSRYQTATHEDAFVFIIFFIGLFTCLAFSSAFHTFSSHCEDVCKHWLILDILGILCLVTASWVPGIYYGFYCQRGVALFYLTMILSLSAICTTLCLVPFYRTGDWKDVRNTMLVSLGISGFVPMGHAAASFGIAQAHQQMGWGWFILEAGFYLGGVAIYASKWPEKLRPGVFDIWGSSHQIFHVFVLLGAGSHLTGIVKAFEYNHNPQTRLCSL